MITNDSTPKKETGKNVTGHKIPHVTETRQILKSQQMHIMDQIERCSIKYLKLGHNKVFIDIELYKRFAKALNYPTTINNNVFRDLLLEIVHRFKKNGYHIHVIKNDNMYSAEISIYPPIYIIETPRFTRMHSPTAPENKKDKGFMSGCVIF